MTAKNFNFLNEEEKPFTDFVIEDEWVSPEFESRFLENLQKIKDRNKKYIESKKHL
jgi:hypothetical protein